MGDNIVQAVEALGDWSAAGEYLWLYLTLAGLGIYEILMARRYRRLLKEAARIPHVAPLSVKGGMLNELGKQEAGLILREQLSSITKTYSRFGQSCEALYRTAAFGREIVMLLQTVYPSLKLLSWERSSDYKLKKELIFKVGAVEIPVGAMVNLFVALFRLLPVPYRSHYLASLIHVSLVATAGQGQLIVHRERRGTAPDSRPSQGGDQQGIVLARTAELKSLSDVSSLLRDAAFMIIQVHGRDFPGRDWRGMRPLTDGLEALDEFMRTASEEALAKAHESFRLAAETDPANHEAQYLYASMLYVERTSEAIDRAIVFFTRALGTCNKRLKAFALAGLARCYFQQFHRLARRDEEVVAKATENAVRACEAWREPESEPLHPSLCYTLALVKTADEGTAETRSETQKRFLEAASLYLEAVRGDPENGSFHNNLGWVLLKLAEWGVEELNPEAGIPPEGKSATAEKAEYYLRRSLHLNPSSKLTHANLCLLYATPRYRQQDCLERSRYHGLKAIQLDPDYINGHRDLALALLRYRQIEDAYKYFTKALDLATTPEKDQELIDDALRALEEVGIDEQERARWRRPDSRLLEPPHAAAAGA